MLRRVTAGAAVVVCVATAAFAAQPQFWKIEGPREFLEGETEGLSVDSEGRVRLAPAVKTLHDPEAPSVWALARDAQGRVFAGTGNEGRVFRIEGPGTASVAWDAAELEVHALALDKDGRVFAASSPEGRVHRLDGGGRGETFFDPGDKYIWALATDAEGRLLVATGSEGRVHRVSPDGKAEVLLSGLDGHITALAVDPAGIVYAGSAPSGIVYRVDRGGKVSVLHDTPFREVKALAVGDGGAVYAAVIEGRDRDDGRTPAPSLPPAPPATTTAAPAGEVTVVESFSLAGVSLPATAPSPSPRESSRGGALKGAILRLLPSGETETLWSSSDEMPHALAVVPGGVLAGTGAKGKLYRVHDDRTWSMVATFPAEQVTSLVRAGDGRVYVATSNPGRVHTLEAEPARGGHFVSTVKDTETVSTWGRVRWDAVIPAGTRVEVMSRSGNTSAPDATWSAWSRPYAQPQGEAIESEKARFLQLKVVLAGASGQTPVLDTVTAAFLQRNLRPQVQSVTVHAPGEIFQKPISISGELEILGFEGPAPADVRTAAAPSITGTSSSRASATPATAYSRKMYQRGFQTFAWKADDPNDDTLVYDVHYRKVGDDRFRILKKGLTDAVLAWDTSTVPNGRYVIRVTASDAPSNPETLALAGDRESVPFEVDNTPPTVTVVAGGRTRVEVTVRDESSHVRRTEYSVDGGRWQEVHPRDGISDALEERYEIPLGPLEGPSPHVVVVRASDLLGNVATGRVEIP